MVTKIEECEIELVDEEATNALGRVLAQCLPTGTTINLRGTLGAGKTRLVQSIAEALGVPRELVTSPTFVLCQHYEGSKTIHHLDAYRLMDDDEFFEIGGYELIESSALTFIEWGDRVADCLPLERMEIELEVVGETHRRARVVGIGEELVKVVAAIRDS